jgi:cell division septum initiation protein DivIVA
MSDFDSPGVAVESPPKRRPATSRFSGLGDRIARTFAGVDRANGEGETQPWTAVDDADYPVAAGAAWEELQPPFPVVRRGYDPAAVDEYINGLEQEIDELRAHRTGQAAVAQEIDRIGEQTAAILRVAHEKAQDVTREAQAQADKCVADAAANALAITENANRRLRDLDAETDAIWQERARLIDDVRNVATALVSLAEDAAERYPGESEQAQRPAAAAEPAAEAPAEAGAGEKQSAGEDEKPK